jgi:ankyrin repeat protein
MLLNNQADVNFASKATKMTALHWAVFNDDAPTVKKLLAAGAK